MKVLAAVLLCAASCFAADNGCRVPDPVPAFKADANILTRIHIHGKDWRVVSADLGKSNCAGYTELATHTIYIDRNMVEMERGEILLHETIHAAVGATFSDKLATGHQAIYAISPALQRVLRDNPPLVSYIVTH